MKTIYFCMLLFLSFACCSEPLLQVTSEDRDGVRWLYFSVADVTDVYGMDLQLQFDTRYLQVMDASANQPGIQVSTGSLFGQQAYEVANYVDMRDGNIRLATSLLHPANPIHGRGEVAVIGFQHLEAVDAALTVERLRLGTKSGELIEVATLPKVWVEPAITVAERADKPIYTTPAMHASMHEDGQENQWLLYLCVLMLVIIIALLWVIAKRSFVAAE